MNQTVKNVALGSVGAAGLFLASSAVTNASEVHTVSSNDTVWALAQKYGVSQDAIEKQNKIDPQTHIIYQGQKLTINSDQIQDQPKAKTNGSYTVKAGDSLWTIAQSAGISVAQLRQANGLDLNSSVIQPGQSLNLTVSKQASRVTLDTNANAQVSSTPQVSEQSEPTKASAKQQSVSAEAQISEQEVKASETKATAKSSELKNSTDEVNTESSVAQTRKTNNGVTKSVTAQERSQVSKQAESASSTTETQQPVERKVATSSIKQQTVSKQNVSKPVQRKVVQPKVQQPTMSQKSTNSTQTQTQTQTTTPKQNVSTSEAAAKEWIAQKESGGSYTAKNGQYYGRYQLTDAYLNHDYSAANQEKVANAYVTSAYGSWNGAKTFWLQNGWY